MVIRQIIKINSSGGDVARTSLVLNPCSFAEIKNLINTFPPLPAPLNVSTNN